MNKLLIFSFLIFALKSMAQTPDSLQASPDSMPSNFSQNSTSDILGFDFQVCGEPLHRQFVHLNSIIDTAIELGGEEEIRRLEITKYRIIADVSEKFFQIEASIDTDRNAYFAICDYLFETAQSTSHSILDSSVYSLLYE